MARTSTLLELRTSVAQRGDYENSDVFTPTMLIEWINDAIAEVYDLLVQTFEGYFTTDATLVTVAGSDSVLLPAGFYKLDGLDIRIDSSRFAPLRSHSLAERNAFGVATGRPVSYRLQAGAIRLLPTPSAVETLRLAYTPFATKLASDGDTFDGINGYERLVIEKTILQCDKREERPISDRMDIIERMEAQIRTAANARDAAEPTYLDGGAGRQVSYL